MSEARLAVVTGASSGIGLELARLFAADGHDLVIAADDDRIETAARDLATYGTSVRPVRVDLADPSAVERLYETATESGRAIDAAALNAGTGRAGRFVDGDLDADLRIIDVNVRSTVHLAKLVLRDMTSRGAGRLLFTSSLVAMMPGSYQSMYNASKAFVQSFAQALHDEFRDGDVTVTALMPGATDTDFFRRVRMLDTPLARMPLKDDPAKTARQGYDAMLRGDRKVVASSPISKATGLIARALPDSVKATANRLIATPFGDR
ncbi:SDR family NAD(P)-dependent oxidoreductase [Mycolicibacterium sediminis]|uniref:Oxidoreductase n=1 Tax=Mycolicibacterium sediminis TaxID=1286180 RepID=A0A7I7QK81_9MYCO|nr:SDR family NAD(P)-dependent oxidoreductase [Mycolicibacterium sediminis]BBY26728.1 oxidoreductase [Mycolicibacterium sediminis]